MIKKEKMKQEEAYSRINLRENNPEKTRKPAENMVMNMVR